MNRKANFNQAGQLSLAAITNVEHNFDDFLEVLITDPWDNF